MTLTYQKHRRVFLKSEPGYDELWVQGRINEDPSLLGLGDLEVRNQQKIQPHGGRLDMLLVDPIDDTRYELELQLGPTDESHIIRTIEYWDVERKRFQQYEHVGVIVAEEITSRFFNVISLFNQSIPLIAIQLSAIEVNGVITLVFTKVLDLVAPGTDEDDAADEPRDRPYWENKASPAMLKLTDEMLTLIREQDASISLKYNKYYIGLARNGSVVNFVTFRPRRQHLIAEFRIQRTDELTARLQESGLEMLTYAARWGRYRMQLEPDDVKANRELLSELVTQARNASAG